MPIIRDGEEARHILNAISESHRSLPCFCTESIYTTEAIFKGAKSYKDNAGLTEHLPVMIAFTGSYSERQQLKNYTGLADPKEGILAVKADIERLAREDGPYSDLDVIVHLDHAQPGNDDWIIEDYSDFISSVMWDCSHYSLQDNARMMNDFISRYGSYFIVEGAVDEIYNYDENNVRGEITDQITDPDVAAKYFHDTGCDLIVANLGTEHRRTEGSVTYRADAARAITERIGRKLTLHGTSSIEQHALFLLPEDGIVKVNLWGRLESDPGKKMAETLLREISNQLSGEKIGALVRDGLLGQEFIKTNGRPSIHFLTEKYRRDEIYLPVAISIVMDVFEQLHKPV